MTGPDTWMLLIFFAIAVVGWTRATVQRDQARDELRRSRRYVERSSRSLR